MTAKPLNIFVIVVILNLAMTTRAGPSNQNFLEASGTSVDACIETGLLFDANSEQSLLESHIEVIDGVSPFVGLGQQLQIAGRCGSTEYYCKDPTPVCCWSESKGYYCAKKLSDC